MNGIPMLESGDRQFQDRQPEIDQLSGENARLREQNEELRRQADKGARAVHALGVLRKELGPLHKAITAIFGELEHVGIQEEQRSPAGSTQVPAVWASWKQKLGPDSAASRFIDALLDLGELNVPQLRVHMKAANQTVYDSASKLNKLGLITKNGGKYSLRKLS